MADLKGEAFYVQALYAYSGVDTSSLSFRQGDIIEVLSTLASGWWDGVICEQKVRGWFPSNYVQRISDDDAAWAREEMTGWWDGVEHESDSSASVAHPQASDETEQSIEDLMLGDGNDFSSGGDIFLEAAAAEAARRQEPNRQPTHAYSSSYPTDAQDEEDYWVPKITYAGQLFYYNTRTRETSRDMPADGEGDGVVISPSDFAPEERTTSNGPSEVAPSLGPALELHRMSMYSDDSALDVDFGPQDTKSDLSRVGTRSTLRNGKRPSTVELLETPLAPLVADIDASVASSLQALISGVGMGGMRMLEQDAGADADAEREQLAALGEAVVTEIRTLLHCAGVLDHPSLDMVPPPNQILGVFSHSRSLPSTAIVELRPHTRRITSSLSKLVLAVRAVYGLLETLDSDRPEVEGEEGDESASDALRKASKADWVAVRDGRLSTEAKLRSEVLSGARDVQSNVLTFLGEFERLLMLSISDRTRGPVDRTVLRMPKAAEGALQTHAAALLLPGGGYGANWRGNGFVTLPEPEETGVESHSSGQGATVLRYAYPTKPLTADVAKALASESLEMLDDAEALRVAVTILFSPVVPTPPQHGRTISASSIGSFRARPLSSSSSRRATTPSEQVLNRSVQLIGRISSFLTKVEDIDVAATVDYELVTRGNPANEGAVANSVTAEFRASVQAAKPLLAELEVAKQQLYDISPALLLSVQDLFRLSSSLSTFGGIDDSLVESGPESTQTVLAELKQAVEQLCQGFTSLGAIATTQSAVPSHLRSAKAVRTIRFNTAETSTSSSQTLVRGFEPEPPSPTQSFGRRESRESVDSDFFFPSPSVSQSNLQYAPSPPTTPSTASKSRGSKTSAMFSAISGRRESNATTGSRESDGLPFRKDSFKVDQDAAPSPTRSPSKMKLAQILGTDSPVSPMRSSISLPEAVPGWLGPDYGPDEISFNMEGQVKGGTMKALVIAAASHEGRVDSNYLSTLLTTYRTFCTSHQLLDLLFQRFQVEAPMGLVIEEMKVWETRKLRPIRARVANVLKSWVREHMDHDEFDADLLRRIADFATTVMRDPVQSPQIIKVVEERLKGAGPRQVGSLAPGPLPVSLIPRGFRKLKFIDIDPLELARQLTIMDGRLFSRITPQECLGKAWPKEYGSDAPNISAMIDMSNGVTRWVTSTILQHDDAKKRANIIKHFISVAERCLALNNFSTLIHIIAGLNSTPIHRLRRTWETMSSKSMLALGTLNRTIRPDKNYKDYRELLRGVAPPCVPFLGVYLTDWTFIGDGNADMLREKPHQINFQKRQKASELILMIKLHQSTTYNLAAVPVLIKYLEEVLFPTDLMDSAADDQRMYEVSLMREPREREDEKIARLLSESGFL